MLYLVFTGWTSCWSCIRTGCEETHWCCVKEKQRRCSDQTFPGRHGDL